MLVEIIRLMMDVKRILGQNLKMYRKKAGFTQDALAEKLDISAKHLSNIEIGQKFVSARLLESITQVLNVSPSSLFYSPDKKSYDDNALTIIDNIIDIEAKNFIHLLKINIRDKI